MIQSVRYCPFFPIAAGKVNFGVHCVPNCIEMQNSTSFPLRSGSYDYNDARLDRHYYILTKLLVPLFSVYLISRREVSQYGENMPFLTAGIALDQQHINVLVNKWQLVNPLSWESKDQSILRLVTVTISPYRFPNPLHGSLHRTLQILS